MIRDVIASYTTIASTVFAYPLGNTKSIILPLFDGSICIYRATYYLPIYHLPALCLFFFFFFGKKFERRLGGLRNTQGGRVGRNGKAFTLHIQHRLGVASFFLIIFSFLPLMIDFFFPPLSPTFFLSFFSFKAWR